MTHAPRATQLNVAAVVAALAVALLLAVIPSYGGGGSETLIEHEGSWVLAVLLAPVLLAAVPLLVPASRRHTALVAVATVAVLFVIVTGFSVGMFFAPTAILLVLAAGLSR